jgi:hypothetical protein
VQIQKLILILLLLSTTAYAGDDDEASCMDKAQYLSIGLKLTEHLLYAVEHVNTGKSVDEVCAQKFREKYYEDDLKRFNLPLIAARIGLEERKITSSENFPYIRRNKKEQVNMQQVCQMVEKHLTKNNRCMEPEGYMRSLMTKKIISRSFEENCNVYLKAVVANVATCR